MGKVLQCSLIAFLAVANDVLAVHKVRSGQVRLFVISSNTRTSTAVISKYFPTDRPLKYTSGSLSLFLKALKIVLILVCSIDSVGQGMSERFSFSKGLGSKSCMSQANTVNIYNKIKALNYRYKYCSFQIATRPLDHNQ